MTNREYTARVAAGDYPTDPLVLLDEPFVNHAGSIQNLLLDGCQSVAVIESGADTVRANHWHQTDWHYTYVTRGRLCYCWCPAEDQGRVHYTTFKAGDLFFTPPRVAHAMYFIEPTTILTFARNRRDHEHHEADVVRVSLIKPGHQGLTGWQGMISLAPPGPAGPRGMTGPGPEHTGPTGPRGMTGPGPEPTGPQGQPGTP